MGEVYRAIDSKLGREVAIKVLTADLTDTPDMLARFEHEAQSVASLDHPNIGALYEFQTIDDTRFLVMQLIEGETLATPSRKQSQQQNSSSSETSAKK